MDQRDDYADLELRGRWLPPLWLLAIGFIAILGTGLLVVALTEPEESRVQHGLSGPAVGHPSIQSEQPTQAL